MRTEAILTIYGLICVLPPYVSANQIAHLRRDGSNDYGAATTSLKPVKVSVRGKSFTCVCGERTTWICGRSAIKEPGYQVA